MTDEAEQGRTTVHGSDGAAASGAALADLAKIPFFSGLPEWALARLAATASKTRMARGALVVRQNDEARALYLLLDGAVRISVRFDGTEDVPMGLEREPGSLIGWSTFRAPYRYTDSVRCEEESELLRVPREAFEEIFESDPYLGYRVLKRIATTVDHRLEGAVASLEDLEDPSGAS